MCALRVKLPVIQSLTLKWHSHVFLAQTFEKFFCSCKKAVTKYEEPFERRAGGKKEAIMAEIQAEGSLKIQEQKHRPEKV